MKKKLTSIRGLEAECKMDSSSMIDMVFQLILFFMVSSRMLTNQIDPRVELPVATNARPPEEAAGRIVLHVYDDGSFGKDNK
jgi:biopolymer transport protein ExbD